MNMKAVSNHEESWIEYIAESILAGCHLILVCEGINRLEKALFGLVKKAQQPPPLRKKLIFVQKKYKILENLYEKIMRV